MANDSKPARIESFSNLNDFLEGFQNADLLRNIENVTWNAQSQTVVIKLQELLERESDQVEIMRSGRIMAHAGVAAVDEITQLSEKYKERYSDLLKRFEYWKPAREKLIKLLRSSSNSLNRNSSVVSTIRVLTSAADILGTVVRTERMSDSFWANFAMEHVASVGLFSHFLEITLCKKMLRDVKKAIKEDNDRFKEITELYEETEDLDEAAENLFKYGIDKKLTQKIAKSASNFTDYNKIFMSVIGSNVRKDTDLFKNRKFLEDADRFSKSEAGKQWFNKIVLGKDAAYCYDLNKNLASEIQEILSFSPGKNPELYAEGCRVLPNLRRVKITLNAMTIISAGLNLVTGYIPEESEVLTELLERTEKGLRKMEEGVENLKPPSKS